MSRPPLDLPDLGRQHRRLQRLVVALIGDEHGAEDVVQDTWLRTFQHGPREPREPRAAYRCIVQTATYSSTCAAAWGPRLTSARPAR